MPTVDSMTSRLAPMHLKLMRAQKARVRIWLLLFSYFMRAPFISQENLMLRRDWLLDIVMSKEPHVELIVWVLKAWGENPHACNFHWSGNCINQRNVWWFPHDLNEIATFLTRGKIYLQWTCFPFSWSHFAVKCFNFWSQVSSPST